MTKMKSLIFGIIGIFFLGTVSPAIAMDSSNTVIVQQDENKSKRKAKGKKKKKKEEKKGEAEKKKGTTDRKVKGK